MAGAEPESSHNQPEQLKLTALAQELTVNEHGESLMGADADSDKPIQQSLFSVRSGIQDLLTRAEPIEEKPAVPEVAEDAVAPITVAEAFGEAADAPAPPEKRGRRSLNGKRSRRQLDRARRRQMNYLEKRREQKRRMVFYQRIRLVFKLSFAILWSVLLWEMLHIPLWNFDTPRFQLQNQHLVQAAQIAPLLDRWTGKPIYAVDTGKIARDIKKRFPVVEVATVRRRLFPARLDILITEKTPWAEIHLPQPSHKQSDARRDKKNAPQKPARPYGLIADNDMLSLAEYHYSPATYGSQTLEHIIANPNTRIRKDFLNRVREMAWQARQIPGLHLVSVDIRNPQLLVLNFQEVSVILGRTDNAAAERLARLIPLVPKINELREGIESVDLRWEQQVTFHTKPNVDLGLKPQEHVDG